MKISGLQVCDVDAVGDLHYIRHSWNDVDKLKDTKNGDDRTIPIEHGVALVLLNNARRNPNYSDTSFVFWSHKIYDQPMWLCSFEQNINESVAEDFGDVEKNVCSCSMHGFRCVLKLNMELLTVIY